MLRWTCTCTWLPFAPFCSLLQAKYCCCCCWVNQSCWCPHFSHSQPHFSSEHGRTPFWRNTGQIARKKPVTKNIRSQVDKIYENYGCFTRLLPLIWTAKLNEVKILNMTWHLQRRPIVPVDTLFRKSSRAKSGLWKAKCTPTSSSFRLVTVCIAGWQKYPNSSKTRIPQATPWPTFKDDCDDI